MTRTPAASGHPRSFPRTAIWLACLAATLAWLPSGALAQLGVESSSRSSAFSFDEYPTMEGVLAAHKAGRSPREIIRWIRDNGAYVPLDLDDAVRLRTAGVDGTVMAAMVDVPPKGVVDLLAGIHVPAPAAAAKREGLSKRELLKMVKQGASDAEISEAVNEHGSRAQLSLEEALELRKKGLSAASVAAIGLGVVATQEAAAPAVKPAVAGTAQTPSLDDIFAGAGAKAQAGPGAQPRSLDEIFEKGAGEEESEESEGEEETSPEEMGTEAHGQTPGAEELRVVSDVADAKVMIAPGSSRPVDLLRNADKLGTTPVQSETAPGDYFILVDKPLDSFDDGIIPAFRTVHDGKGDTRTLIEAGRILYDAHDCCLPKSLNGEFTITRISADQRGMILGDEFDGLPPYLWDGNRYLILVIEKARVERVIKVYEVRKSAGESQTVIATFISSLSDPLQPPVPETGEDQSQPSTSWNPNPADVSGIASIMGVAPQDVPRMIDRIRSTGKATLRSESKDGLLHVLSVSSDSNGRTMLRDLQLKRTGPFGSYASFEALPAAPPPANGKKKTKPQSLEVPRRVPDPNVDVPVLTVSNSGSSPALLRFDDGLVIYVAGGQTRESQVGPGNATLTAIYADRPETEVTGHVHFSYHSRYRLSL